MCKDSSRKLPLETGPIIGHVLRKGEDKVVFVTSLEVLSTTMTKTEVEPNSPPESSWSYTRSETVWSCDYTVLSLPRFKGRSIITLIGGFSLNLESGSKKDVGTFVWTRWVVINYR